MKIAWKIAPLAVVAVFFLVSLGPKDAQINLRTGDLRYRCFGIPFQYDNLHPPYSTWLAELTSRRNQWVTVATFPLPTSNNSHAMCQGFFASATVWITVDRELARAVLRDVEDYVLSTQGKRGLPESCPLLWQVDNAGGEGPRIHPEWKDDPAVQAYLTRRNAPR